MYCNTSKKYGTFNRKHRVLSATARSALIEAGISTVYKALLQFILKETHRKKYLAVNEFHLN